MEGTLQAAGECNIEARVTVTSDDAGGYEAYINNAVCDALIDGIKQQLVVDVLLIAHRRTSPSHVQIVVQVCRVQQQQPLFTCSHNRYRIL